MIIANDMTDSEIAERLRNVEKSLHDQQEKLWKRIDVLNNEYLNTYLNMDLNMSQSKNISAIDNYVYRKKLSDLVFNIRYLRSLELLLGGLFNEDDRRSFDEHVNDLAQIYCRLV